MDNIDKQIARKDKQIAKVEKKLKKRTLPILYEIFERHYLKRSDKLKQKREGLIKDRSALQDDKLKTELVRSR